MGPFELHKQGKKRIRGVVINFLNRKGFGFIMGEDGVKVFVHYSDVKGKSHRILVKDEPVEYSVIKGDKGIQAVDVVRLDPPKDDDAPPPLDLKRTW